jgi:glyoxylase-like metal-dependent hydrolase (beta-lactamase superfamily II)
MAKSKPAFEQVTPHIYKLNLLAFGGRLPVGVWLVQGGDGWTVVDAGVPPFEQLVLEQILARTGGALPARLVLTHGHLDHGAAAERMRDEWKLPVAAGRAEIPYLTGTERYNRIPSHSLIYKLLQGSPPALNGRNVQLPLDEGMRVGDLTVFAAPGHAPGMVALLHSADRALICGDAWANFGGKLSDPLTAFTADMDEAHRTQAKLAELDFDHLLVSHGPPVLDTAHEKIRALAARREKKQR